jgi:hypothetical protein
MMTPVLRSALLTLIPLSALTACAETPYEYFVWRPHAAVVEFGPEPLYCYKTLARVDCFATPLDRTQNDRIVGYYGPRPGRPVLVPVAVPSAKNGTVIDHPPLAAPREAIESEPLPAAPAAAPPTTGGGPIPLTRTP